MLKEILYDFRIKLYKKLVLSNTEVYNRYEEYKMSNSIYHEKHKLHSFIVLLKIRQEVLTNKGSKNIKKVKSKPIIELEQAESNYQKDRQDYNDFCSDLLENDIISFDIFDTLILRKVENPIDIFSIIAHEMEFNDFRKIRQLAERKAREAKEKKVGKREVTLEEIYLVLNRDYDIDFTWMQREIELELEFCIANPYMKKVYDIVLEKGKVIYLMSDMYLPRSAIERILKINGYSNYHQLFLSNELNLIKGDGTLQKYVMEHYIKNKAIIHIGDNYRADIKQSAMYGYQTKYYASVKELAQPFREKYIDNLAGSFYRATINNYLHDGLWKHTAHFEHGFKVGGILTYGYCNFINQEARKNNSELILFCARDCDVIYKAYNQCFKEYENHYIAISRLAILNITLERYLYDFIDRFVIKMANQSEGKLTYGDILREVGFDCIIPYMNDEELSEFDFPRKNTIDKFRAFILEQKKVIIEHNQTQIQAAIQYFSEIIENRKKILVVDIGWSGSCITILKYFFNKYFKDLDIKGILLCANNTDMLQSSLQSNHITTYIMSPQQNRDLNELQFINADYNNMLLEYMFTSTEHSLKSYQLNDDGYWRLEYIKTEIENSNEIQEMQKGILYFVAMFHKTYQKYSRYFSVTPYIAIAPYMKLIDIQAYQYLIYKNYLYDANPLLFHINRKTFSEIFYKDDLEKKKEQELKEQNNLLEEITENYVGKILLVSHELTYTGAPHSLLRICRILKNLGYYIELWCPKDGEFKREFISCKVPVKIIQSEEIRKKAYINKIKTFDLAILNTIFTDEFLRVIGRYIPTMWFIREATNIPKCCEKNPKRFNLLSTYKNLYCVSEYAANYIKKYNSHVQIINNCVEDFSSLQNKRDDSSKVRFIQLGTIEYRKGYDVLLNAFEAMPLEYQEQSELYFAGQCRQGDFFRRYWTRILSQIKRNEKIIYLGEIKDVEKKIKTLSQMDVVVVASRDESCSLVALEGTMMSKPLIVTENVGAKYMVTEETGYIVNSDDIQALKEAMMKMIDNRQNLPKMGRLSRKRYEQYASIEKHTKDLQNLIQKQMRNKDSMLYAQRKSLYLKNKKVIQSENKEDSFLQKKYPMIVSMTSHPARIPWVHLCIKSLLRQELKPDHLILWLAKEQFPKGEKDLPRKLLKLEKKGLEIKWCEDLKSHKKYYYSMLQYPDSIVITVDDDVFYEKDMTKVLYESFLRHPYAISCMRAHRITFDSLKKIAPYKEWKYEDKELFDIPSYQMIPTGVGGVLYPPHSLREEVFDKDKINKLCLNADDIWLKVMSVANNYPSVLADEENKEPKLIKKMQDSALFKQNVFENANDVAIKNIFEEFNTYFSNQVLSEKIYKDKIGEEHL